MKKKFEKIYKYNDSFQKVKQHAQDKSYGMYPAPMSAQDAINILCDYLLGDDWYFAGSCGEEQGNAIIVDTILSKYSKEYVKDWRHYIKYEK